MPNDQRSKDPPDASVSLGSGVSVSPESGLREVGSQDAGAAAGGGAGQATREQAEELDPARCGSLWDPADGTEHLAGVGRTRLRRPARPRPPHRPGGQHLPRARRTRPPDPLRPPRRTTGPETSTTVPRSSTACPNRGNAPRARNTSETKQPTCGERLPRKYTTAVQKGVTVPDHPLLRACSCPCTGR